MSPTARAGTRRVSRTRLRGKLALLATAAALSLTAVTVTAAAAQADANVQISGPATAVAGTAYTYTVTDPITPAQHADGSFIDFTLTGAAASITAESDNDSANVYCDAVSSAEYQCTDYAPSVSTWVLTFTVLPLTAGTVTAGVALDDGNTGSLIGSASTTTTTTGTVPPPTVTGVSPATGLDIGGDPVTITGTNLAGVTAVTFGPGNDATNVYCTATSCTAVSPPGADGTVDVQVTTSAASTTSSADQFTYLPVIGIAGPASAVQAGTPYTYTVTVPEAPQEFGNPQATVTTTLSGAAAAFTAVTTNAPGNTTCTLTAAQVACTESDIGTGNTPATYLVTLTVTPAAAGTVTAATALGGGGPGSHSGTASTTTTITALFPFTGFFSPVDNPPTVNMVKAGQSIPIKFSLGSDLGLGIIAAGYPTAQTVSCTTGAPVNTATETDTAGGSGLQDNGNGSYTYVWKTSKASAGTCQVLTLGLTDGTVHTAEFQYK